MDVSGDSFGRLTEFYRTDVTELYNMAKQGQVNTPPNSWAETWGLPLRDEALVVDDTPNKAQVGTAAGAEAGAGVEAGPGREREREREQTLIHP